ncbi:MAG TPA: GNAT family N-acetyltransferase, partial [Acidimicrobiia bacterium]|nr:GNAT family N-acetyltransferase [Acidimicrobiia bacterium]
MTETVRPAVAADLARINEIYNHYIVHSHATFQVEPVTMAEREEWASHYADAGRYRLLVVADDDVLGYATSSPYHNRPAYETSVEVSVYLDADATGRGLGAQLYGTLIPLLEREDLHRAYGGVALPNPASVALHERFGFREVARYSEQGRKFGRYWD